jgi:hypothetical protein
VIVSGQVRPSLTSLTHATVGAAVQLSASSVTTVISGAGTSAAHSTLIGAGLLAVGLVTSLIVIVWVTLIELPQSSVTLYVLVIVSGHVRPSETSETHATTGAAVQLSASSVTTVISGAGTSVAHSTLIGAGLLAVGSVTSLIVIVWVTLI